MALSTGLRPRSREERLRLADALRSNASSLEAHDAWEALHIRVAGKLPVWCGGDPAGANALLTRFGFPTLDGDVSPPVQGPTVSIVICTHNRYGLLTEAISTALAQTWPCQVIVVDDGSTDGTADLLSRIDGIEVVALPENVGKPRALAQGIARVRGELLLIFDDDDLLLPGAVQVLATALVEDPRRVGVFGDAIRLRGGEVFDVRPAHRAAPRTMPEVVCTQVPGLTGAFLCRTAAYRELGGVDPRLSRGEDMDLFLRLSLLGPVEAVPIATFLHRVHDGLRGQAGARWSKRDRDAHRRHTMDVLGPVFEERWRHHPPTTRRRGHAWALGLSQRARHQAARAELDRWPAPHTPYEAWIRQQCGVKTSVAQPSATLVLVDDGDPGALEACLAAQPDGLERVIALENPRDPLGDLQLHWPGVYALHADLATLLHGTPGPWHLRMASSPGWRPPPLQRLSDLPPLTPVDAVLSIAATWGWPLPTRDRLGLRDPLDPRTRAALSARRLLSEGRPGPALGLAERLMDAMPAWSGSWRLAADCFEALGAGREAEQCRARLRAG